MNERRTALVCSADDRLLAKVAAAGFEATKAPTRDEALPRVQHEPWAIVVTDSSTDTETLRHLSGLSGVRRRDLFVVKVGANLTTGDRFQAWSESADLVVHDDATENLGFLVEEWMHDKERFYGRFREVQAEPGTRLGAHA